jgi:hypothetical protein
MMKVSATLAFLCFASALVSPMSGAVVPDERDHLVLESLLLHLLADSEFDMTRAPTNQKSIVLHTRTPEKTGFLMSHQIRSDIRGRTLPSDAEADLRTRNTPSKREAGDDSVMASYTNLTFQPIIVLADLTEIWKEGRRRAAAFEKAYPQAKGWLDSYLPGYSRDGTRAVVRAGVGPSAHGAMLTAVLEKTGDKWLVKWYQISRYA